MDLFDESIAHTTSNNQFISFLKHIVDKLDLILDFRSTDDNEEWSLGFIHNLFEEVEFLLHQMSSHPPFMVDTNNAAVCSVSCAECVIYKHIAWIKN